jgi:hypothetical protein
MGYLVQVLDGVMRNVEISEFNDRLLQVVHKIQITYADRPWF